MKISTKTESGAIDELSFDAEVDSRITYPSYKSFDEFIDVDRLRSLDGYIKQRIKRRLDTKEDLKSTPDRTGWKTPCRIVLGRG
jgi:hypothetical protein